jgi:Zn finger protein HypA/HybF involved in hydrogenase expression
MKPLLPERDESKARTRLKAGRMHRGQGHWHVEVRSSVIVCGECEAQIPRELRPAFCPECGAGRG